VKRLLFCLALQLLAANAWAQADIGCDLDLTNSTGPWDYRTTSAQKKHLVESYHFTRNVEALVKGRSGSVATDIDYTLRVFPNHPRALMAMSKLGRREKTPKPPGSSHSINCWFERAIKFQPNDATVRLIYGIELLKDDKRTDAIEQLKLAESLAGENPNVYYNLGLAYFDLGDYDKSLDYAHKAYGLGFPLPGLRDKLKRAGKWKE
jgi:Tfp pilus assembly protein PilF